MFDDLLKEVLDFCDNNCIKDASRAEYRNLYTFFIDYLRIKYSSDRFPTVEGFLSGQVSRFDIINSCVAYVENSKKVKAKTAIEKYLNSITYLYDNYFIRKNYRNPNLDPFNPFSQLNSEVSRQIKKQLLDKEPTPILTDNEFDSICTYMKTNVRKSRKKEEIFIIWKLMLLYGFKLERIGFLQIDDFIYLDKTIKVRNDENDIITLKLPSLLADELNNYIDLLKPRTKGYIFLGSSGKSLKSSFFSDHFNNLKLNNSTGISNAFCTRGLAKYAICQMLKAGVATYHIRRITGMESDIIEHCQQELFDKMICNPIENEILNQSINEKLNNIHTIHSMY